MWHKSCSDDWAMWYLMLILLFIPHPLQAREPALAEVQRQAEQSLGVQADEMDRWHKRSRWAAAMPRLQVGFVRQLRDVVSLTTNDNVSVSGGDVLVGPTENSFDQDVNQATAFEVKALWQLSDAVFNRDELAVSHERREWLKERQKVLREVTESYLVWVRLQHDLRAKRGPIYFNEKKRAMLDQVRAILDAHTGGWFSRELAGGVP